MTDNKIMIYSLSTCGHCKSAKKFLNDNNIPFNHIDVDLLDKEDRRNTLETVKKYNERVSFPTIVINETVIVGFKENDIKEALGLNGY